MPRPRIEFDDSDGINIFRGFYEYQPDPSKHPPLWKICTIQEANFKTVFRNGRQKLAERNPEERVAFLRERVELVRHEVIKRLEREHKLLQGGTEAESHYFKEAVEEYREFGLIDLKAQTQRLYETH